MRNRSAVGIAGFLLAAGCGRAPSEAPSKLAHGPIAGTARAVVTADEALMRRVIRETKDDARKNTRQWFGDRNRRTPAEACAGLARLIAKHMVTFDDAKGRHRTNQERLSVASTVVQAAGCGAPTRLSMYGNPFMRASMLAAAVPDSVDDWLAENWRAEPWTVAVQRYMNEGPGPIEPYTAGLTEFEVANLDAMQCSQSIAVDELGDPGDGGDDGEDPMMMYFWPAWSKAALIGCGGAMITAIPEVAGGVRSGAALGGPWGAVAGGVAVALEYCLYGAIAGYYVWKLSQK